MQDASLGAEVTVIAAIGPVSEPAEPSAFFALSLASDSHSHESSTCYQHVPRYGVQILGNFGEREQFGFR